MVTNRTSSASFVIKTLPTRLIDHTAYLEAHELRCDDDKRRVAVFVRFSRRTLLKKATRIIYQAHEGAQELQTGQTLGQWRIIMRDRILPQGQEVYLGTYVNKDHRRAKKPARQPTDAASPQAEVPASAVGSPNVTLLEVATAVAKLTDVLVLIQGQVASSSSGQ
jgi:hypothetical protein